MPAPLPALLTHLLPVGMPQIAPQGSPVCPLTLEFTAPNLLWEGVCGAHQLLPPMSAGKGGSEDPSWENPGVST